MKTATYFPMKKGLVTSDLHNFTKRSHTDKIMKQLEEQLVQVDLLVLNGDIFDFRWSIMSGIKDTIHAAESWLKEIIKHFPHVEIHFVLGNHDCHQDFITSLEVMAKEYPTFFWHEFYYKIENRIFLHGDCANRHMTAEELSLSRGPWRRVKKKPHYLALLYALVDKYRITIMVQRLSFSRQKVASRIIHYLNSLPLELSNNIEHIFFGHTHLPFTDYSYGNYYFHNTGAGIIGTEFMSLYFEISGE